MFVRYMRFYLSWRMNYKEIVQIISIGILLFSCKDKEQTVVEFDEHQTNKIEEFDFTNELINETSPYLLQHAHNPVNWRPWGDKAFEVAKENNQLIILSIGYSSCHWCHVMEEESFDDENIAQVMNKNYVSIKVDREERPDVDIVYQTALELVEGTGGWPLNAILLPDGKPVYLGTYHDKESWQMVLNKFIIEYANNPSQLIEYSELLTNGVKDIYSNSQRKSNGSFNKQIIREGVVKASKLWDKTWGGNLGSQKFVMPSELNFLLDYAILENDADVQKHIKNTLDQVASGGLQDHVGGGFFRYSTDRQWKTPHFEKMLYDNAQLLSIFSKAYRTFKEPEYKHVLHSTIDFLQTEMKQPNGGYVSAIDADIDGKEGEYYYWTVNELKNVLGKDFSLFSKFYDIQKREVNSSNNFFHRKYSVEEFANLQTLPISEVKNTISKWKHQLLEARNKRKSPKKDDKIITSWNALLVKGFIDAYVALGEEEILQNAINAFDFLIKNNYRNKKLVHSYKDGSKIKEVFLEDYAFLIESALALYKVTLDGNYLNIAIELNQKALNDFLDSSGLLTYTPADDLISKIIRTDDGVMPSANAVMAKNLLELGHILYDTSFMKSSENMLSLVSNDFKLYPQNFGNWGVLALNHSYPYFEIVVCGPNAKSVLNQLNQSYLPNALLIGSTVESEMPLLKNRYVEGKNYIYLCRDNTCKLPTENVDDILKQFKKIGYHGIIH